MKYKLCFAFCLLFFSCLLQAQQNLFKNANVVASSEQKQFPASMAIDGLLTRNSTWISAEEARPPHILEISADHYCDIDSIVLYTGIPSDEKKYYEEGQSPGFWNVKNFIIQYWDDANWTDLTETMTTENRLDKVVFHFSTPVSSYRFRLYSTDGEPIRVIELEGYGKMDNSMVVPTILSKADDKLPKPRATNVRVKIACETEGQSLKYVGYNQGYYLPNSNVSGWLEYSGVNSLRVWASLSTYASEKWLNKTCKVANLEEFEQLKESLRADPENCGFILWDSIAAVAVRPVHSTNTMVMNYVFKEMSRLGIDIILQISNSSKDTSWENKWKLWQRYYALAFYAAKVGDVSMFAMQNEPNHRNSGPVPLEVWIELMKVVSDAVHCAVFDVNRLYQKNLKPKFIGPVTAGTTTNWWAQVAASERVDYRGEKIDHDLIDLFSTHSYNLPAAGYISKVQNIDQILRTNHPFGKGKPILFTEIGRWMNAYLIDKEETMDSPSLFTEWAGIYTNIMKGGGYGMWAFKFANTISNTYPRGIKSGHHHIWKGRRFFEDSWENLALGKPVRAVGTDIGYASNMVTDGNKSNQSAWAFTSNETKWIEIDLGSETEIGGMVVYTGSAGGVFTAPDRIRSLRIEQWNGLAWELVPGTFEENCRYAQLYYEFESPIKSTKIRILTNDPGKVIIREVKLFGPNSFSQAMESYDVSGVQRTAQVVRLFAKGFKEQRPLLKCDLDVEDADLDICASVDSITGRVSVWLVQRNLFDYILELDLSELGISQVTPVIYEQVSNKMYGEACLLHSSSRGSLSFTLPAQSVGLLTFNPDRSQVNTLSADQNAVVIGGNNSRKLYGGSSLSIALDSRNGENNHVTYIRFSPKPLKLDKAKNVLLGVHGYCNQDTIPYRFHVYAFRDGKWNENQICWDNAPFLNEKIALVEEVGTSCSVAGELTMNNEPGYHYLDVSGIIKNDFSTDITFVLIREGREPGDDYDKNRVAFISSRMSSYKPILKIW